MSRELTVILLRGLIDTSTEYDENHLVSTECAEQREVGAGSHQDDEAVQGGHRRLRLRGQSAQILYQSPLPLSLHCLAFVTQMQSWEILRLNFPRAMT